MSISNSEIDALLAKLDPSEYKENFKKISVFQAKSALERLKLSLNRPDLSKPTSTPTQTPTPMPTPNSV
jgi:hypothetical protein